MRCVYISARSRGYGYGV